MFHLLTEILRGGIRVDLGGTIPHRGRSKETGVRKPMLTYTIDDPITESPPHAVEVTVKMAGERRWCFFITPHVLESVGDFVEGTRVRMHLGVPHMIVVSELTTEIVDRVLRQLHESGRLMEHTQPLI